MLLLVSLSVGGVCGLRLYLYSSGVAFSLCLVGDCGAVWLGLVYLWVSVDYVVYSFDLLCGLLFVFGLWWVFSWLGCAGW